jgi:hypothetical protein
MPEVGGMISTTLAQDELARVLTSASSFGSCT